MTRRFLACAYMLMLSFNGLCIDIGDFSFDYNLNTKTGSLNGYHGTSSYVTIPSSFEVPENYKDEEGEEHTRYHTITVTGIYGNVFTGNPSIVHVSMPDSICNMESHRPDVYGGIFEGCTALQSVSLSRSLRNIESYAFKGCGNLKSIDLSNVLTNNIEVFYGCSNLTTIGSLENATFISSHAFQGCSSLSGELSLPAVRFLFPYAFAGSGFTKVRTGSGLRKLDTGAFSDCHDLEEAIIGGTFTGDNRLQPYCFRNCGNLRRVEITANMQFRSYNYNPEIFAGCNKLEEVALSSSFTSILGNVFRGLPNLRKVTFSNNMKEICAGAFSGCMSLADISLNSVTTIGEGAFENCIALKDLRMSNIVSLNSNAFKGCTNLQSVAIGSRLRLSGGDQGIFQNCTALKDVTMTGDGECTLPNYTFSGCKMLETCTIGNGFSSITPLNYHYSSPFEYCDKLRTVSLGRQITNLPNMLFEDLSSLETCMLTAVTNIGNKCFSGCGGLKDVSSLETVERIGESAFSGCSNWTAKLTLPAVKVIDSGAFNGCYSLTGCVELASIVSMGDRVFKNCSGIRAVKFGEALSTLREWVFTGSTNLAAFAFEGTQPPGNVNNNAFGGVASGAFGIYPMSRLDYDTAGVKLSNARMMASESTCTSWEDQIDANGMWKGLIMGANKPILTNDAYYVDSGALHLNWANEKAPMPPTSCGVTYEVRRGFTDSYESAEVLTNGYDQLAYEDKQFDFTGGVCRIWYWVKPEHEYVKFETSDSCRTKNRYFLSLGFGTYGSGVKDKGITKNDAEVVAGVAADEGGFLPIPGSSMSMIDAAGTCENLDNAMSTCAKTVKPGDIVLCYLATHGSMGSEIKQPTLLLYQRYELTYFHLSGWCSNITSARARFIGIIMSCHSEAMVNGGKIPADEVVLENLATCGLRKCGAYSDLSAWVTSCRAWERSQIRPNASLSTFTTAFCVNGWKKGYADVNLFLGEGLDEGGRVYIPSHGDERLTLQEISEYAQNMSVGVTKNSNVMIYNADLLARIDVGSATGVHALDVLSAPKNVKVERGGVIGGGDSVSWDAVSGAEEYRIYRQFLNGNYILAYVTSETSFKDTVWWSGIPDNYRYFVQAVNATGTSKLSVQSDLTERPVTKRGAGKLTEANVRDYFAGNGLILADDLSEEDWMKLHDADLDGDGVRTGEESISGVSPLDSASQFMANIAMENGQPIITPVPDLGDKRIYTTYGKKALDGNVNWVDMATVPEDEKAEYHFFKIGVSLP